MNVLIIKLSPIEGLNSSMLRTLALTRGLLSLGYKVDFLTIPASENQVITEGYEFLDELNIIKTKTNVRYDTAVKKRERGKFAELGYRVLKKVYHKFSLYNYTLSIAKKVSISMIDKKYYDLIISTSDPKTSHIAAQQLILNGVAYGKWIQYWGDPMTLDITNKSIYPKWYVKKKEYSLLKNADKVVYVSPFTAKKQKLLFPDLSEKMNFIPVPYIEKKIYSDNRDNEKFVIGYYGAYKSKIRNIMPLYNTCINIGNEIQLDIVGDSDLVLENKSNINIYPRGDISEYEEKADLLVCMLNNKGTQIPGKIYHYAATNKPVLILLDGDNKEEMRSYLESFNRYIICDNEEVSIANAIQEIRLSSKKFLPCESFNPNTIAKILIS